MTLRLSDEDDEALERQARRAGLSNVAERDLASDVGEALDVLTPRYQRLLDRLGSV
jgi:hypothetical protein